jgi:Xaa-Pro aminopeptidase
MDTELGVDLAACRQRQHSLLQWMDVQKLDRVILTTQHHIQYFFGPRFAWTFAATASIDAAGASIVIAPHAEPAVCAADRVEVYRPKMLSTMRNDQAQLAANALAHALGGSIGGTRMGVEFSAYWQYLSGYHRAELVDVEPHLLRMRRKKAPDELAKLRKAIQGTAAMYDLARQIIRPGITELEVYNRLQAAANEVYGEPMTGTGNDYQVNSRGGGPRAHVAAQAGQLYILDLGPAFRGYFADNARTIAVSDVSPLQMAAWQRIQEVFEMIAQDVKPGVSCRTIFEQAQAILDRAAVGVFNHHLGHGIGLFPHEAPHLNPNWDDVFEVGDVFTVEPGLYAEPLQAGLRIENDYLVTEHGIENLSPFPMELQL